MANCTAFTNVCPRPGLHSKLGQLYELNNAIVDWTSNIAVHESASPEFLREQVIADLRESRIHPHLLYAGLRQASLWTALHHAISPAQRDATCAGMYEEAFAYLTKELHGNIAHVISLACGDGSKDTWCLQQVRASGRAAIYSPVDLSIDLVLTAARHIREALPGLQTTPLLSDLRRCPVLPAILKQFDPSGSERIILLLGAIHNFWPADILRSVLYPVRSQDQLLLGVNLAPEKTYDTALSSILAQYDNAPTRSWLMGALSELGLSLDDGTLIFSIASSPMPGLKRIEAQFKFARDRRISIYGESVELESGQELGVFLSYRFTPAHIGTFVREAGLAVTKTWIAANEQEGLFLCRRAA